MQRRTYLVALLTWMLASAASYAAVEFSDSDLADANRISRLVGRSLGKETSAYLDEKRASSNEAVAALACTALFVASPKKHRDGFYQALSIDDYAQRKDGKKKIISFGDFQRLMKSIDARAKGDKDDERIILLIEFIDLKDQNLWFEGPGGHISLARFIRGMYLGSAFAGSKLDAEKIANEIDKKT